MSVFGAAELLAMKIGVEALGGLCYKFCMMGRSLVGVPRTQLIS